MLRRNLPLVVAMATLFGLGIGGMLWLTYYSLPSSHTEPAMLALNELVAPAGEFPPPGDGPLSWPRDHSAKLDQFAEYWLFAGLLAGNDGRRYGFQLALFRLALQVEEPVHESAWATRDIYRAQLLITAADDVAHISERYSRGVLGLSGASNKPLRVWLENWQVEYDEETMALHLKAADAAHGLDLRLAPPADEPQVLGGAGYRGYWIPGLVAEGELTLAERRIAVSGRALLDRLWGRALPIGRGQLALSRLWLELDDGSALRCRQLRRRAGGGTPIGECLLRRPDGTSERFEGSRISWEPVEAGWRNLGGVSYPLRWRLQLAEYGSELRITPFADEQAPFAVPLWSGTVEVNGRSTGWGLLELSNYATP